MAEKQKIGKYDFKAIEENMLKFWDKSKIYKKAKDKNKGIKPFYFLDGPPYTSGKIHLGIAWNKSLKDSILRFKRMNGFDVWDRAGYDMHGLPTELKVEKKLGLKHKDEVPGFGIAKFIEECKRFSLENLESMNAEFMRLGIWMDFENPYMSIKNSFIEGEWWLLKKAHENKRLYEGEKVMHWCQKCATALAKHELEYENVKDDSIFVKFPVSGKEKEFLIIWTTTPWTIPYNLAVMVNPTLDYVKAKVDDEVWIVSKGLSSVLIQGVAGKRFESTEEFKGDKLLGMKYKHPFSGIIDYENLTANSENMHTVILSEEYVDLSAGSGLVHCAPGCGPEDYEVGHKYGIPPFNNLDEFGKFPDTMGDFSGKAAKKDDDFFIEKLKELGFLIETTEVEHDYAHCWRCKRPVIFRTTKQWFFKIEDMKDKMKELNKDIKWVPDWAGNRQFNSWLDNLRDNGITRQRFWGSPVPIWKCKDCNDFTVVGSISELKKLAGSVPEDLHRPYIDEVEFKCECGGMKKRIPDILDVWIDAGTTSWTCLDYPQKTEMFEKLYPPDFILEGKDQIRGWFNLLFVASMVSMDSPAYKAVYMHGFVQDAKGRKMSKSIGNIISPYEVIDKYGSDTLRYYMIGGANPGLDINYNFDDMRVKNRNLMILWNLQNFIIDFARTIDKNPKDLKSAHLGLEERYILSKLNTTVKKVTDLFNNYELNEVPLQIEELFLEISRSYIKFVREKCVFGSDDEKQAILFTGHTALMGCIKLLAPISPFIADAVYQNLRSEFGLEDESIHLISWPLADKESVNESLENKVTIIKDIIQSALSEREKAGLNVRWPIKALMINNESKDVIEAVEELNDLLKTQLNVKEIIVNKKVDDLDLVETAEFRKGTLTLDLEKVPELIAEGYSREIMRRIQTLRKKAGLNKQDRISLCMKLPDDVGKMVKGFEDLLKERVGASEIDFNDVDKDDEFIFDEKIKDKEIRISFRKL